MPRRLTDSPTSPRPPDPAMPKIMPTHVERELQNLLGFRTRPNPVDVYNAIRDALERGAAPSPTHGDQSNGP